MQKKHNLKKRKMANPTKHGREKGYIASNEKYYTVKYKDGRVVTRQVSKTLIEATEQAKINAKSRKTKVKSVKLSVK